jgi:hypothetical protein
LYYFHLFKNHGITEILLKVALNTINNLFKTHVVFINAVIETIITSILKYIFDMTR